MDNRLGGSQDIGSRPWDSLGKRSWTTVLTAVLKGNWLFKAYLESKIDRIHDDSGFFGLCKQMDIGAIHEDSKTKQKNPPKTETKQNEG